MVTTPSGHVGFNVLSARDLRVPDLLQLDWDEFAKDDSEVAFGRVSKDRVVTYIQGFRGSHDSVSDNSLTYVNQCCDKNEEVSAHDNEVLKHRSRGFAPPSEPLVEQDGDTSTEEKGRLCGAPQAKDISAGSGVGEDDSGETSSPLSDDQAGRCETFANELASIQQSGIAAFVHDGGVAGLWGEHLKDSAPILGQGSFDCRAQQLCGGSQAGDRGEGCHTDGTKDQQDDRTEVLGCMVYPNCTFTLSLQYVGVDAAQAQRRQGGYPKPPGLQLGLRSSSSSWIQEKK